MKHQPRERGRARENESESDPLPTAHAQPPYEIEWRVRERNTTVERTRNERKRGAARHGRLASETLARLVAAEGKSVDVGETFGVETVGVDVHLPLPSSASSASLTPR